MAGQRSFGPGPRMSEKIVNLRRFRKQKARRDKAAAAADNRARHGRSKAEKARDKAETTRDQKAHEGRLLTPETDLETPKSS
ncbi:MAG: DUF4169 family protein [Pseudomonadota bacterium]|nr:DUF4169 family protein [Pseudomonadota bacterium]MEC9216331.1 DUF4169 family protein [Pseudomonadota bacterium]